MQPPVLNDNDEHKERLERRFQGFPYFRPSAADVRARSRENRAASVTPRSPSPMQESHLCGSLLLAAAKSRNQQSAVERVSSRQSAFFSSISHVQQRKIVADFVQWVTTYHFNLMRLWRILDKDGSMQLTKMEFLTGIKQLRHQAELKQIDLSKVWSCLDGDGTGTVSLFEFAPEHAMDLARLKQWAQEQFGSMRGLFKAMDADGNGKVSFKEFNEACINLGLPKRLHRSTGTLFRMLEDPDDDASKGLLTEAEMCFLDSWKCPSYLREKANDPAAQDFRRALVNRHAGNALAAWRKCLDMDGSMKVGYDEFITACKQLAKQGVAEADPDCGVTALYCVFDTNRSGWFTLKDWDPNAHSCLCAFVTAAQAKHGKVTDFIRAHEKSKNEGLSRYQFRQMWKAEFHHLSTADADLVFCGLAGADGTKRLLPAHVLSLQKWEPDVELEEDKRWTMMAEKRRPSTMEDAQVLEVLQESCTYKY